MSEELKLSDTTAKFVNELAKQAGKSPQEIHDALLYEGLRSLDGQNPNTQGVFSEHTHIGQVWLKMKNLGNKTEIMFRPPGAPPLSSIPEILKRRR